LRRHCAMTVQPESPPWWYRQELRKFCCTHLRTYALRTSHGSPAWNCGLCIWSTLHKYLQHKHQ
jgi:hypothetical protein